MCPRIEKTMTTLHIKTFNDRIKVMNQTQARDISLTAQDARNLQSDIFALLELVADLTSQLQVKDEDSTIEINVDGGKF